MLLKRVHAGLVDVRAILETPCFLGLLVGCTVMICEPSRSQFVFTVEENELCCGWVSKKN
jgi:hypothetical protein